MSNSVTAQDEALLTELETALWRPETRYDRAFMSRVLSADFFEYGRSGRTYDREAIIDSVPQPFITKLPLPEFHIRILAEDVVQITYISEATYDGEVELGRRSSIWTRAGNGWELRFHQGTPFTKD